MSPCLKLSNGSMSHSKQKITFALVCQVRLDLSPSLFPLIIPSLSPVQTC